MNILSPMPTGSGAIVLHSELARLLGNYRVRGYSPWWELMPLGMLFLGRGCADLIHTTVDYGLFFRRSKVPLVVTAHNYVLDRAMRPYAGPLQYLHYRTDLRLFHKMTLGLADGVTAVSRFVAERLRLDIGYQGKLRVIYNGIDENRFVPGGGEVPRRPFRVFFCGNTNRRKRAELLVPLANRLGEGFEIAYTAGLSGKEGVAGSLRRNAARLVSLGRLSHAEMPGVYQGMDALFMPSAREGFGLCVAEAMGCGLPVVASNAGALPELVQQGQGGYLCAIDDVEACAQALKKLAQSPADAKAMGEYNRARVEGHFTLKRMVAEYRLLFEEVLDAAGRSA